MKSVRCLSCAVAFAMPLLGHAAPVLPAPTVPAAGPLSVMAEYLNPGGSFYLALDSRGWSRYIEERLGVAEGLSRQFAIAAGRDGSQGSIPVLLKLARDSGLRELAGVGASSVETGGGMYHNRLFLQHLAGGAKGLFWDMFTAENEPLDLLGRLPENTAVAYWVTVRPAPAWDWLRKAAGELGIRALQEAFQATSRPGQLPPDEVRVLLESLAGGVGLVGVLDPARRAQIDLDGDATVGFPAFDGALLVAVKDDRIFDLVGSRVEKSGAAKRVDANGIRSYVWEKQSLPDVSGYAVEMTLARFDDYLALATSLRLVESLAAGGGGLLASPRFQRYRQAMPTEGFAFSYLDPSLGKSVRALAVQLATHEDPEAGRVVAAMMSPLEAARSFSVATRTPGGIAVVANEGAAVLPMLTAKFAVLPMLVVSGVYSEQQVALPTAIVEEGM